jgi:hypothetical protein
MKIGLINIDSKIPNIALMKLSAYHKARGDKVEWWKGVLFHSQYDKVYASKVFDFSELPLYMPGDVEIGGSGYDIKKRLPGEIEYLCPDYDLYPDCDYSIGFLTRGCPRKCGFCKVPEKEGNIVFNQTWNRFRNPNGKHWVFLDNNILAYKNHQYIFRRIIKDKIEIDFNQGMDIRLVTPEAADLLSQIKWKRFLRFSFDHIKMDKFVEKKVGLLVESGIKAYRLFFYVLIGYNSTEEEDLYRVELLRGLGVDMFVMPYNKSDLYQMRFARWVNRKAIFKTVAWKDYKRSKPM